MSAPASSCSVRGWRWSVPRRKRRNPTYTIRGSRGAGAGRKGTAVDLHREAELAEQEQRRLKAAFAARQALARRS